MLSNSSAKERLVSIEQCINERGIYFAGDQLDDFLNEYENPEEYLSDDILNIQLQVLIGQGRFKELEEALVDANATSIETIIRCLIAEGILANRKQDYRASLISFLDAESKAKVAGTPKLLAQIQINIGTVYAGLHHYQEGLDRYADVLDNYGSIINESTRAALLHNLGNLNYANGNISESIRCLEASLDLNNELLIDRSRLLLMRSELEHSGTSTIQIEEMKVPSDLQPVYYYCLSFLDRDDQRLATLSKVAELAKENSDFKTELDALGHIIDMYKTSANWELAFDTREKYRSVEQALLNIQQTAKLAEQAARYELAEKEQSILVLEKEKELKDEIVKRNDMLEVVNEELRQFAYVVSHDLKEPLRMIGAYTQLIEMGMKEKIDSDSKEYFGFVSGGVTRLNVLLDGLSNYSTLKSLQEKHQRQSLSDIIQTATENLDILIKETESSITFDVEVKVNGSTALLVLLFQNLLQNAIKFRKKDRSPDIHIKAVKGSNITTIDVSDNGLGIAKNQIERVFVIFQRLSRNHSEGSGMGLAICKKIVQLHEGRIYVKDSKEGEGTTFCIELPN